MIQKIEFPQQPTYYILRDEENGPILSHGKVEPSQVLETIRNIMETYIDENEWEAKLLEGGIDLNEQEDLPSPLGGIEL